MPFRRSVPRVGDALRREPVAGAVLVAAALLAVVWANSPWAGAYAAWTSWAVGPAWLHLHLPVSGWTADGLLAVFFFVAGVELKRELVVGELSDPARALLPVAAAVGGMAAPALIFLAVVAGGPGTAGWAVPTATDIAFALAVLAVGASRGPSSRRTFLLTLAVVDDLLAITIIAVAYTDDLAVLPLLAALVPLGVFALVLRRRPRWWWLLAPAALATWVLVHASGVHATVAGVLLGLVVPVGPGRDLSSRIEHRWRPWSAGVAVPAFALTAAGVSVAGAGDTVGDPVTWGVVAGLVAGKVVGVAGTTFLVARCTRVRLADDLGPRDVLGLGLLAGIGFTVSLLIGELAFGSGSPTDDHAKVGVLAASVLAAGLGVGMLRRADAGRAP